MKSADRQRYDRHTIVLHWTTVALVLFNWIWAHAVDNFPRGPLRVDARSIHIVVGVALLAMLSWRIAWRRTGGTVIARGEDRIDRMAGAVHILLYALLLLTLALGLLNAWVRGDSLFGLVRIPPLGGYGSDARHDLSERITDWHALSANAVLIVGGGHAVLALIHELAWRDDVLRRMLPGRDT